jgi:hypothetical protein
LSSRLVDQGSNHQTLLPLAERLDLLTILPTILRAILFAILFTILYAILLDVLRAISLTILHAILPTTLPLHRINGKEHCKTTLQSTKVSNSIHPSHDGKATIRVQTSPNSLGPKLKNQGHDTRLRHSPHVVTLPMPTEIHAQMHISPDTTISPSKRLL